MNIQVNNLYIDRDISSTVEKVVVPVLFKKKTTTNKTANFWQIKSKKQFYQFAVLFIINLPELKTFFMSIQNAFFYLTG